MNSGSDSEPDAALDLIRPEEVELEAERKRKRHRFEIDSMERKNWLEELKVKREDLELRDQGRRATLHGIADRLELIRKIYSLFKDISEVNDESEEGREIREALRNCYKRMLLKLSALD